MTQAPHKHRPSRVSKEDLALDCVEVLGTLAALFEERRRQLAQTAGLSVQQWQALEEVQHEHFMPSMFAQRRSSSAAAVSKILKQLSDKDLVRARISKQDGRQREYEVTPLGEKILARVRCERQQAISDIWLKLPRETLQQFHEAGSTIAQRLENKAAERR